MVAIRSKREVEKIAESSRIVADSLDFLEDKIVEGVTGMELDKIAEDYIRSRDAEPAFKGYMGYPATLCISVNDEVVHGIPNDTSFKNGDIVGIDCGALKDGYYGDHARTYMIGNVSQELQDLVNLSLIHI